MATQKYELVRTRVGHHKRSVMNGDMNKHIIRIITSKKVKYTSIFFLMRRHVGINFGCLGGKSNQVRRRWGPFLTIWFDPKSGWDITPTIFRSTGSKCVIIETVPRRFFAWRLGRPSTPSPWSLHQEVRLYLVDKQPSYYNLILEILLVSSSIIIIIII